MRRALLALAVISGGIFVATPAHADHVVDILSDGTTCRAGSIATHIGVDLLTTKVTFHLHPDGWVRSFTCRFADVPANVPAEYPFPEWNLPDRKVSFDVGCWRSQEGERVEGVGTMSIKPNGTATVTCTFQQAPG